MALIKREYKDQETVITAENLNDIQDAVIALEDGLFSIDNDKSGEIIAITDAAKRGFRSMNIYGKSTQAGTPTPDAPVELVSVENPVIGLYGKNLFTAYTDSSKTENGISFSVNGNGSITINGAATGSAQFNMFALYELPPSVRPGATYIISGATSIATIHVYEMKDSWVRIADTASETSFVLSADATGVLIRYVVQPNTTVNNLTVYPMLRLASIADNTYEQSKPAQTAMFYLTLRGIPVTSGGNYTDANGQQWVCDEVDFARGVFIRRVGSVVLNGGEPWSYQGNALYFYTPIHDRKPGTNLWCDRLPHVRLISTETPGWWADDASNNIFAATGFVKSGLATTLEAFKAYLAEHPIVLLYVLETPIETPLSTEELAAYAALYTYKEHTTVSNDAGAWMELEYSMDAKKYIDSLALGGIVPATVE